MRERQEKDDVGKTELHSACKEGNIDDINRLLVQGFDIIAKMGNDDTPLTIASNEGNIECIKILLDRGADINIIGEN